ncbi:MAG: hypothetical protein N3G19_03235 [Candidatus Pacearchaeota archaeon]|nr:hypothetical protein [Candidatus Pacearchaeota archaeon]
MAMFAELQCALFISAIYDRNLEAIKLLLNTLTGTITDLKACGLSQLLNFTDYRNFDDEAIKETKMYKKWCQIMNEKEGLLEELIFDYEKLVSDILAEKKIYEDVDTQVQEFLAELEEKVLVNRILKNNANNV